MNPNTTLAFGGVMYPEVAQQVFINIAAKDAPLSAILLATREEITTRPQIDWYGHGLATRSTQINNVGGYNDTTTLIVVDSGAVFAAGDLLHVERTNELMLVTAVSTNTLTVVRSFGAVAAAALLDDDYVLNVGPAKAEAAGTSDMRTNQTTKYTSYTQIFERSVQLSGTLAASVPNTENERVRLRREQMHEIARDIELACLFGDPGESNSGGTIRRSTSGFIRFANANVSDANGTITKAEFLDFLSQVFAKGAQTKLGFAGYAAAAILTSLWSSTERSTVESKVVGLTFQRIATPWGNLDLIVNPHLTGTTHGRQLLVVDPEQAAVRSLVGNGEDRRLRLLEDLQTKTDDAKIDKWFAELGFTWGNPDAHGILSNIQAAG